MKLIQREANKADLTKGLGALLMTLSRPQNIIDKVSGSFVLSDNGRSLHSLSRNPFNVWCNLGDQRDLLKSLENRKYCNPAIYVLMVA